MTTPYKDKLGKDLDDVFHPLDGNEKAARTQYKINGEDLCNRYAALTNQNHKIEHDTGYMTSGRDLREIFAKLGSLPQRNRRVFDPCPNALETSDDHNITAHDMDCIVHAGPPPPIPDTENFEAVLPPRGPVLGGRVHFGGGLMSTSHGASSHQIFNPGWYRSLENLAGIGDYSYNATSFAEAINGQLDGIAIDRGTRLIVWQLENFKGDRVLDITGPAVINNSTIKSANRYIYTYAWSNNKTDPVSGKTYTEIFPLNVRQWSATDMRKWLIGGSSKIRQVQDNFYLT